MTEHCFNPIGFLNEFSQKHKDQPVPSYAECSSSVLGQFSIKCTFGNCEVVRTAHTKKEAKRYAADSMITLLNKENYFEKFRSKSTSSESLNQGVLSTINKEPEKSQICSLASNPISVLNEYCQTKRTEFPVYTEAQISGSGFIFRCKFQGEETHSFAITKKSAKTKAALAMCKKLNLRFMGEKDLPMEKDDFQVEKNAVIALNEMLAFMSLKAVYETKPPVMNLFVIVCVVGRISGEGRDTTKKGAKISAANQVLQKLSNIKQTAILKSMKEEIIPPVTFLINPYYERTKVSIPESNPHCKNDRPNSGFLEEFNVDTDEE